MENTQSPDNGAPKSRQERRHAKHQPENKDKFKKMTVANVAGVLVFAGVLRLIGGFLFMAAAMLEVAAKNPNFLKGLFNLATGAGTLEKEARKAAENVVSSVENGETSGDPMDRAEFEFIRN